MGYTGLTIRSTRLAALAALLLSWPSYAANICDPTTGTDCAKVSATPSFALRNNPYDARGNNVGQKATYTAGSIANVVATAGTGVFFTACGSATKTVRVQKFTFAGASNTATIARGVLVLQRYGAAPTGGTCVALTQAKHDTSSAVGTASTVQQCSGAPAIGSAAGGLGTAIMSFPGTTLAATDTMAMGKQEWNFGESEEGEGIVLRGIAECIAANFVAAPAAAILSTMSVTWTEE